MNDSDKPTMAGYDLTQPEYEVDYRLVFLPPDDAFYTFKGHLGESRLLPGRDGPPGAQYLTLPPLMPPSHQLITGYRGSDYEREHAKLSKLFEFDNPESVAAALTDYRDDFVAALQKLGQHQ